MRQFCGGHFPALMRVDDRMVATDASVVVVTRQPVYGHSVLMDSFCWHASDRKRFLGLLNRVEAAVMVGDSWQAISWRDCSECGNSRMDISGEQRCEACVQQLGGARFCGALLDRLEVAFGPLQVKSLPGNPVCQSDGSAVPVLCFRARGGDVWGCLAALQTGGRDE